MTPISARRAPVDGDTKACPQCRQVLVFSSRYPLLTVGMALIASAKDEANRIRYEPAWVCRNGGCDYRELVGE